MKRHAAAAKSQPLFMPATEIDLLLMASELRDEMGIITGAQKFFIFFKK